MYIYVFSTISSLIRTPYIWSFTCFLDQLIYNIFYVFLFLILAVSFLSIPWQSMRTIWATLVPFQMCLSVCPYVSVSLCVCIINWNSQGLNTRSQWCASQLFVAARLIVIDKFGLLETFGKLFALRPMKLNPMFIWGAHQRLQHANAGIKGKITRILRKSQIIRYMYLERVF